MYKIFWIIKLSKLCNLRCSYCYEWDELDDTSRMSDEVLRSIFRAAKKHHNAVMKRTGEIPQTVFVWHGGEPLIIPVPYLEKVQRIKREEIGPQANVDRFYQDTVQSNLYKLSPATVDFLRRYHMGIGVSFDVVPGVRRTLAGGESEARVLENMDVLRENQIRFGAISVLAKHTAPHVQRIYDFFDSRQMSFRVLPLFNGPESRPMDDFSATEESLTAPMCELFDRWMADGCRRNIMPLTDWFQTVVRGMLGLDGKIYDRRQHGERYILVNTDGTLYAVRDAYETNLSWGTVDRPLDELSTTPRYLASLARDDEHRAKTCEGCDLRGACSSYPAFESRTKPERFCGLPRAVMSYMREQLVREGFGPAELRDLVRESLSIVEAPEQQLPAA